MKQYIIDGLYAVDQVKDKILNNDHINYSKRGSNLKVILLYGIIPRIVHMDSWTIKQKKGLQVLFTLPPLDRLIQAITDKYDVWMSINLYSLNTLLIGLITWIRGKEFYVIVNERHYRKENILGKIATFLGCKITTKVTDKFIAYSTAVKRFLHKELGISKKQITTIPKHLNFYNDYFDEKKSQKIKSTFFSDNKSNILFVGRVVPFKGLDILIKALSICSYKEYFHLIIVGDTSGKYGDRCIQLAKDLNISHVFVGKVGTKKGSEKVKYFYQYADLFVLPNKYCPSEFEPLEIFGSVVDEALSSGLPVIATTATGSRYDNIIGHDTGKIAKAGSVQDLIELLNDFKDHEEVWKKMGAKGPSTIREKNKKNAAGWENIFKLNIQ